MPHDRFFTLQALSHNPSSCLIEDPNEIHHLQHVMKCQIGDDIEVIDGKGSVGTGTIIEFGKQKKQLFCHIQLKHIETRAPRSFPVFLALAMTRPNHLEFALEKCTELGVSGFYLFPSEYSERAILSEGRKERYQHIIRSALKQSGCLFEPACYFFPSFETALHSIPQSQYFSDLSPHAVSVDTLIATTKKPLASNQQFTLFIGPEKGWSEKEKALMQTKKDAQVISLSESILRAETAAIIGCHDMIRYAAFCASH